MADSNPTTPCKACGYDGWIDVLVKLPITGRIVLVTYRNVGGNSRIVRAEHYMPLTLSADDTGYDDGDEWAPPGWYESTENVNDDFGLYLIHDTVTHWMPLPTPPGKEA